jgi:hypothetical protein
VLTIGVRAGGQPSTTGAAISLDLASAWRAAAGFRAHPPGVRRGIESPPGILRADRERLPAEDVLARPQRLDRPLDVHRDRQRNVNGIHAVAFEQDLVGGEGQLQVKIVGEPARPVTPRLATATKRAASDRLAASTISREMFPVDSTPHRTGLMVRSPSYAGIIGGAGPWCRARPDEE